MGADLCFVYPDSGWVRQLGVEAENLNAFHLYEKAGMQCTKRYVDYRRQITVS